jgi:hypothetical protein
MIAASFDHLVGAHEQRERDGEAERLRSLEVDEQLDLGGLLEREISGLRVFEDTALIDAHLAVRIRKCRFPS